DDLLFRKPLSLHQSVLQSRPDSNLRWRKLPVAGHQGGGRNIAEGMSPLKLFEYMAHGKPIVSSDLPAIRKS
ncbi:hypothetical protein, partial [Mesorhizobium sp. M1348]|uniref:hypothetical protein n=1 Tax=unclassified Mesorhizobium TaxID=325217 RepID=UPI00333B5850